MALSVQVVEVADLVVGAVHALVDHQLDVELGELALQAANHADGRVVGVGHAEEQLERGRVALAAQGDEVLVELYVEALERFEHRHRRAIAADGGGTGTKELPGRVELDQVEDAGRDQPEQDRELQQPMLSSVMMGPPSLTARSGSRQKKSRLGRTFGGYWLALSYNYGAAESIGLLDGSATSRTTADRRPCGGLFGAPAALPPYTYIYAYGNQSAH